jgi:DNA-binding response OmpR family regulator
MPQAHTAPIGLPGILVVDDEKQIVDLLTRYLIQHGFRAVGAYSPEQARETVVADPAIAVVVSDVRMPGQSGLALAEELIRGRPESAALEVVLISGAGLGEIGLDRFGACAFDVLRKPFRPSEVASVAARALAASEQRRSSAARSMAPAGLAGEQAAPRPAGEPLPPATVDALRAPLLPILAAAEALATAGTLDAAEARAQAQRIRDGALHLLALIDTASNVSQSALPQTSSMAQAAALRRVIR